MRVMNANRKCLSGLLIGSIASMLCILAPISTAADAVAVGTVSQLARSAPNYEFDHQTNLKYDTTTVASPDPTAGLLLEYGPDMQCADGSGSGIAAYDIDTFQLKKFGCIGSPAYGEVGHSKGRPIAIDTTDHLLLFIRHVFPSQA